MMTLTRLLSLSGLLLATSNAPAADFRLETGRLEADALYSIAAPDHWNGRLLLLAHGLRDEAEPLHAHLFPERGFTRELLARGWIVALTSYRRNGVIVRDAIADLENLRAHVARTHGHPERTYLMGDSMGGLIATRIAERHPEHYDGALAVGAALHMSETGASMLNHQPLRPLLYLSNQSEISAPLRYATAAGTAPRQPVLWIVGRDGHVNVNDAERLAALSALVQWVEHGERPADRHDATHLPPRGASQAAFREDGSAEGRVTFVHPAQGTFSTNFRPEDFSRLGIRLGGRFTLHHAKGAHKMHYTIDPENTPGGNLAGPDADGFVTVVLRGRAAREAKPSEGDVIRIEPHPDAG